MATPYNVRDDLLKSLQAGRQFTKDPGVGGIIPIECDDSVVVCESAGARTLQDANTVPVGATVLVCTTVPSVVIDSVTVLGFVEYRCVTTTGGTHIWSITS